MREGKECVQWVEGVSGGGWRKRREEEVEGRRLVSKGREMGRKRMGMEKARRKGSWKGRGRGGEGGREKCRKIKKLDYPFLTIVCYNL